MNCSGELSQSLSLSPLTEDGSASAVPQSVGRRVVWVRLPRQDGFIAVDLSERGGEEGGGGTGQLACLTTLLVQRAQQLLQENAASAGADFSPAAISRL